MDIFNTVKPPDFRDYVNNDILLLFTIRMVTFLDGFDVAE